MLILNAILPFQTINQLISILFYCKFTLFYQFIATLNSELIDMWVINSLRSLGHSQKLLAD